MVIAHTGMKSESETVIDLRGKCLNRATGRSIPCDIRSPTSGRCWSSVVVGLSLDPLCPEGLPGRLPRRHLGDVFDWFRGRARREVGGGGAAVPGPGHRGMRTRPAPVCYW